METNGIENGMDTNGIENVTTKKMNGFHKGPMELYLVRISPACRAVWLYIIQVILHLKIKYFNYIVTCIQH
jgi:hypothetical protein